MNESRSGAAVPDWARGLGISVAELDFRSVGEWFRSALTEPVNVSTRCCVHGAEAWPEPCAWHREAGEGPSLAYLSEFRRYFADGQRVWRSDGSALFGAAPLLKVREDRAAVDRTFENGG